METDMTITRKGRTFMVNGIAVASSFTQFREWLLKYNTDMRLFKNWPFEVGLSSDLETREIRFWLP